MQLGDLYENDSIFDKFDCCFSGDGTQVATGTYSNCFRVVSRGDSRNGAPGTDQVLEASRDPQRKRLQQTPAKVCLPELNLLDTVLQVLAILSMRRLGRHADRSISQRRCLKSRGGCIGFDGLDALGAWLTCSPCAADAEQIRAVTGKQQCKESSSKWGSGHRGAERAPAAA